MISHLVLFKLHPGVDEEKIDWMMRETRMLLLKIPEVLTIRCGKRIAGSPEWPFFLSIEVESLEKLALLQNDPHHLKFLEEVLKPNIAARLDLNYELEPGRDVLYS